MNRFHIDHGVIHDRVTGKHVVTNGGWPFEDTVEMVCDLLNSLGKAEKASTATSHDTPPEWIWWGEIENQNVVTFGRWPKKGAKWRYKLAEIAPAAPPWSCERR
jgi:hypothetical protein